MPIVQSEVTGAQGLDFRIKLGANAWSREIHVPKCETKMTVFRGCCDAGMVETIAKSPARDKLQCCAEGDCRRMRPV
jgi:hypothetical protein